MTTKQEFERKAREFVTQTLQAAGGKPPKRAAVNQAVNRIVENFASIETRQGNEKKSLPLR